MNEIIQTNVIDNLLTYKYGYEQSRPHPEVWCSILHSMNYFVLSMYVTQCNVRK